MGLTLLAASEVSLFDMNSWWWMILKGLFWIISAIQGAYNYLVGITPVSNIAGEENPNVANDVLFSLFRNPSIQKIFLIFMIFSIVIMVIFLAFGFVKASFKNDDQLASRGKMLGKAFSSLIIMLMLPIIMFASIMFIGIFFQFIASTMGFALGGTGNTDIATIIHNICLPEGAPNGALSWDISYARIKELSGDYNFVLGILPVEF